MKKRVLLIEDNPHHSELMTRLLEKAGLDVVAVDTAEAGIQIGTQVRFDLVLCDIRLPRISGLEFAELVRDLPSFQGVPLVALSSQALASHGRAATDAGFSYFLEKPFDPSFAETVLEIMG